VHIAGFSATCSQAAAAAAADAEAEATAPVCEGEEGGGEAREEANARNPGGGGRAHGEVREALEEERCATAAAARKARSSAACGSRMVSVWLARSASAVGILGSGLLVCSLSFPFPNSHPFLAGLVRARLPAWLGEPSGGHVGNMRCLFD